MVRYRLWLAWIVAIGLSVSGALYITGQLPVFTTKRAVVAEESTPTASSEPVSLPTAKPETPRAAQPDPNPTDKPQPPSESQTDLPAAGNRELNGQGVPILMYHSVKVSPNPLCVAPDDLDQQLDYLQKNGFTTITVRQLEQAVHEGTPLPNKPVVITFDDGYHDNYVEAYPRLKKRHMVATIFTLTNKVNAPNGLSVAEMREMLSYGIEIGSHTQHHLDLRDLDARGLTEEIADSRTILEEMLEHPVVSFCYPSGRYNPAVVAEVEKAGYLCAVTVKPGRVTSGENVYLWPRIRVNGGESLQQFAAALGEEEPLARKSPPGHGKKDNRGNHGDQGIREQTAKITEQKTAHNGL